MPVASNIGAVVLAAGRGSRLGSADVPKVMRPIGGRPMLEYTVVTLKQMGFSPSHICLVVGFQKNKIKDFFKNEAVYAEQNEQQGTAHAAFTGMRALPSNVKHVLVMGGDDSAFYQSETLLDFINQHLSGRNVLTLLTVDVQNPGQLGRVVRTGEKIKVVEKEFLTEEQKKINEISTGTFVFDREWFEEIFLLMPRLDKLDEYALPMALDVAIKQNKSFSVVKLKNPNEWFGVNTPEELKEADHKKFDFFDGFQIAPQF